MRPVSSSERPVSGQVGTGTNARLQPRAHLSVPVLIGTSEGERDFIGVGEVAAVVAALREETGQPIFLNADHTHSLERALEAAKAGYDMIGFDVSTLPLEKNIELTQQAVEAVKSINPRILSRASSVS